MYMYTSVKNVKIKTQQPIFLTVEVEGLRKFHTTGGPASTPHDGSYLIIISKNDGNCIIVTTIVCHCRFSMSYSSMKIHISTEGILSQRQGEACQISDFF